MLKMILYNRVKCFVDNAQSCIKFYWRFQFQEANNNKKSCDFVHIPSAHQLLITKLSSFFIFMCNVNLMLPKIGDIHIRRHILKL